MGCSRDSPSRKIASVGEINSTAVLIDRRCRRTGPRPGAGPSALNYDSGGPGRTTRSGRSSGDGSVGTPLPAGAAASDSTAPGAGAAGAAAPGGASGTTGTGGARRGTGGTHGSGADAP